MSERMNDAAVIAMFESSWFGQGPAFWRWIETPEAAPYIEAFARYIHHTRLSQP